MCSPVVHHRSRCSIICMAALSSPRRMSMCTSYLRFVSLCCTATRRSGSGRPRATIVSGTEDCIARGPRATAAPGTAYGTIVPPRSAAASNAGGKARRTPRGAPGRRCARSSLWLLRLRRTAPGCGAGLAAGDSSESDLAGCPALATMRASTCGGIAGRGSIWWFMTAMATTLETSLAITADNLWLVYCFTNRSCELYCCVVGGSLGRPALGP